VNASRFSAYSRDTGSPIYIRRLLTSRIENQRLAGPPAMGTERPPPPTGK
jgi:hypothetical protein